MKKLLILFNFFTITLSIFGLTTIIKNEYYFASSNDQTVRSMMFDSMEDVDLYVKSQYETKKDFKFITTHNLGVLSTRNVDSWWLTFTYNNKLDWSSVNNKFDLNHDNVINSQDDLGKNTSICSPTAAAILMRYLVLREKISYSPRIKYDLNGAFTDNQTDVFNVFYELVDSYIINGWQGSEASESVELNAMNHFLKRNNSGLKMNLTNKNMLDYIDSNFNRGLPCIGHIVKKNSNIGHTFTIAGYYTKEVTYTEKNFLITQTKKVKLHFLVINDGWSDSTMGDSGGSTQEEYNNNYSYILLDNVYSITYFI